MLAEKTVLSSLVNLNFSIRRPVMRKSEINSRILCCQKCFCARFIKDLEYNFKSGEFNDSRIQWGSEYRTSPVFEWFKQVRFTKGLVLNSVWIPDKFVWYSNGWSTYWFSQFLVLESLVFVVVQWGSWFVLFRQHNHKSGLQNCSSKCLIQVHLKTYFQSRNQLPTNFKTSSNLWY